MFKPFYLTTTLPYVNAPLHLGHALEFVRADAIVRYKKMQGFDVYFNTGTDEHGIKNYQKAEEKNITVQEFVDQGFETFKEQVKMFGVSDDIHFIRTTDKNHEKSAQEFWKIVRENGYIYKKNYQTKYCIGCESEKTDSELVEGKCPDHPSQELKLINEENYFFKYSAFGDKLLEFYERNRNFIIPEFRFHEIKNFVKSGLQDFSISRLKEKMPWGIPVPGDDTQVMYVWFDALINYISTLGWLFDSAQGKPNLFEKYWVNGNPTQYCGKDNTRFQGAMWQAMLMAAGLPNSYQIIVNGFITGEGGVRMSKSLGNGVDPKDITTEYGTDALRYFLLREVSSFEDSPFTIERFKEAYNSGLANGLGNLTSRILTLSEKYLSLPNLPLSKEEEEGGGLDLPSEFINHLENFDIQKATDFVWQKIGELDKTIQETEPYKVIKVDKEKGEKLIRENVLKLFGISKMLVPLLPETALKIQELIKQNKKPEQPLFLRKE
jgi:methionyl-tRNA synthetase